MKRFYKEVAVAPREAGIAVELDGRPMRTPLKRELRLPSEVLAQAIAEEWAAQEGEIDPRSLHLTRMANSAIDRVADHREAVVGEIAGYAATDLVCYRAPEPETLARRQQARWDPLIDWLRERYGAALSVTTGILPVEQDTEALARVRAAVANFDDFGLSGLHMATAASGSVVIALAVAEGKLAGGDAWEISLIDETFQIEEWGEDAEAARRRALLLDDLTAAARLLELCRTTP